VSSKLTSFLACLAVLVLGAGAEELLPSWCGVGFPFLLGAVQSVAARKAFPFAAAFALCAGAMEDSLSGLPVMTSASYFVLVAALVRRGGLPVGLALLTFPVYQLWLSVWTTALGGEVFVRLILSLPLGLAAAFPAELVLGHLARKGVLDDPA